MQKFLIFFVISTILTTSQGIKNYLGTDIQKCINCLCHARTACYSRFNCANYSISFDYWIQAKSPVVDVDDEPETITSYQRCMQDENCIVTTIVQYTDGIEPLDCNCDGRIDCKDRAAIHLFGRNCFNPQFGKAYAKRFNQCSREVGVKDMLPVEGHETCTPPIDIRSGFH